MISLRFPCESRNSSPREGGGGGGGGIIAGLVAAFRIVALSSLSSPELRGTGAFGTMIAEPLDGGRLLETGGGDSGRDGGGIERLTFGIGGRPLGTGGGEGLGTGEGDTLRASIGSGKSFGYHLPWVYSPSRAAEKNPPSHLLHIHSHLHPRYWRVPLMKED